MNFENIYAPPQSNVVPELKTKGIDSMIKKLKSQSTWRLIFLSIITLGIYLAHYVVRQTKIINTYLDDHQQLSEPFAKVILALSYITVILIVPLVVYGHEYPMETISNLSNKTLSFLLLFWAFRARRTMNTLLGSAKNQRTWFHGFWTFLFQVLYFNYKINQLNETS